VSFQLSVSNPVRIYGWLLCAFIGLTSQVTVANQPATTNQITATNIERLAPPLAKLAKSFKPNPKAGAEVILRRTHININDQLLSEAQSYVAVYIHSDEAARDYSQVSISFNSFYEDIALEFAHVRTPDGNIDSIKADATQIQSPSDENFYHDRKELLFSLPNVRKGSIIEFQYRYTDTQKIIKQAWFDSFSFHWWEDRAAGQGSRADYVTASEIQITAPAHINLVFNSLDKFGIQQQEATLGAKKIWRWSGNKLAAIELQSSMARDHSYAPFLRISSISDWKEIAQWANNLVEPHLITDSKLEKVIKQIQKTATTPNAKVKAVYQTLQKQVRYVFAHVGRGGYEPHDASEVFTNGYGDCKDQSVLAVTLLRKLGIKADTALIATRARGIPDMRIPGVIFDHMIVHIPAQLGLEEIWMDTTGDTSLFPGFSVGIEGQPALIVNKNSAGIHTLPTLNAEEHFAKINIIFDKIEGNNAEARFTITLGGLFEDRLRSMWQYTPERDKYFRELFGNIYSAATIIDLKTQDADSLWNSFSISGRLLFSDVWGGDEEPINYGFTVTQLVHLFSDLRNLHKPEDRKQVYVTDPGYSLSAHIEFTSPSSKHQPVVKTRGGNIDNNYYQLTQTGQQKDNRYIVDQQLTLKPGTVSLANYADFYEKTQALLDSRDWMVSFQYNEAASELLAFEQNGKKDAVHYIALTKHHLKQGNYSSALDTAKQAIKMAPQQAEAHYILGLAQGYNNFLPEADASFKKAEAMGYQL
jgi:tetratricopeptide (TPR) repeat protein